LESNVGKYPSSEEQSMIAKVVLSWILDSKT